MPDPYVAVQKVIEGSDKVVTIATSETMNDNRNPHWKPLSVNPFSLCGGDLDAKIRLDVYDYSKSKEHKLVGKYLTSLRELLSNQRKARPNRQTYHLASEDRNRFSCKLHVAIWCDRQIADKCSKELKRVGLLQPGSSWKMEFSGGGMQWCATSVSLRTSPNDFEWFARKVREEGGGGGGKAKTGSRDGSAEAVSRNGKSLLHEAFAPR